MGEITRVETIKQGSTFPFLSCDFLNDEGEQIDCSPFEIRIVITDRRDTVIVDAKFGEEGSGAVWLDQGKGIGEYQWKDGDTDRTGRYKYVFKVKRLYDNRHFVLPEDGAFEYLVVAETSSQQ